MNVREGTVASGIKMMMIILMVITIAENSKLPFLSSCYHHPSPSPLIWAALGNMKMSMNIILCKFLLLYCNSIIREEKDIRLTDNLFWEEPKSRLIRFWERREKRKEWKKKRCFSRLQRDNERNERHTGRMISQKESGEKKVVGVFRWFDLMSCSCSCSLLDFLSSFSLFFQSLVRLEAVTGLFYSSPSSSVSSCFGRWFFDSGSIYTLFALLSLILSLNTHGREEKRLDRRLV